MSEGSTTPLLPFRAHDLQHLLELGVIRPNGSHNGVIRVSSRGLLDVLRVTTEAFRHERVSFALCGALALAFYARPHYTADLEFVGLADQRELFARALDALDCRAIETTSSRITFVDPRRTVEIAILLGTAAPETSAVADALPAECLGVATPVI